MNQTTDAPSCPRSEIPPERPVLQTPPARGFAALPFERRREIASLGGRTAHASGAAHQFNEQEARAAGRRGGASVSRDREHMARIGRLGGSMRHRSRPAAPETP